MTLRHYWLVTFIALFTLQGISSCAPLKKKVYMHRTYKRLKKDLKDAQVSKLRDTVRVLFPSNLMFEIDSFSISRKIIPKMDRFAKALNRFSRTAVLINGHTDNLGTETYNDHLSTKRAEVAKNVLVGFSVDEQRISTWGLGMRHPISTNETVEGRALNRRVEFIILYRYDQKK